MPFPEPASIDAIPQAHSLNAFHRVLHAMLGLTRFPQ